MTRPIGGAALNAACRRRGAAFAGVEIAMFNRLSESGGGALTPVDSRVDGDGEPDRLALHAGGWNHAPIARERPDDLQASTRELGRIRRAHDGIAGTAVAHFDTNPVRQSIDRDREMGNRVAHGVRGELRDHHGDGIGRARRHAADGVEHEPARIAHRRGVVREPSLLAHRPACRTSESPVA